MWIDSLQCFLSFSPGTISYRTIESETKSNIQSKRRYVFVSHFLYNPLLHLVTRDMTEAVETLSSALFDKWMKVLVPH